jgi:ABC-type multidrug transport system fused ATPase/permease subunit
MKAGIVGRTGAGKSSLLLALFRLKGLDGGCIYIDGQDIAQVSLKSLRSQISVIPQNPLLFHGDVRKNVDPTNSFSIFQVNQILQELQLLAEADSEAHQLSAGQKQILCLARVLLRDSQVLICDEATGSIDPKTEDFVQSFMRSRLQMKTVVTIAHRLKTVQNCDLVIVLDQGRCVEQGAPSELAAKGSYFSSMLHAAESSS